MKVEFRFNEDRKVTELVIPGAEVYRAFNNRTAYRELHDVIISYIRLQCPVTPIRFSHYELFVIKTLLSKSGWLILYPCYSNLTDISWCEMIARNGSYDRWIITSLDDGETLAINDNKYREIQKRKRHENPRKWDVTENE